MSGFKKKTATKGPNIRGTVISPKTLQLLTSSGASSLDNLINGGLPVGTIALYEDFTNSNNKTFYSKVLINQFLEEGSPYDHDVFVGSCGEKFTMISTELNEKEEQKISDTTVSSDSTMKIAWRYQNQTGASQCQEKSSTLTITSENDSTSNLTYNSSESRIFKWHITDCGTSLFEADTYKELFKKISDACMNPKLNLPTTATSTVSTPSLIRIAITNIGSLSCCDQGSHKVKVCSLNGD